MSALPRPTLEPGPHRDLNRALHDLHHRAGWPSLRALAAEAGCSHTTVSHAFSGSRLPAWGLVELLVEAMDGDPEHFHQLWLAASGDEGPEQPGRAPKAPPIAGRRAELTAVRRHLEAGSGLLLVSGEAGIGKTRLVATATEAAERVFVSTGHCLPLSTQVPLLPLTDSLRAIHQHDDGAWLAAALGGCPAYVTASLVRQLPELAPLASVEDPRDDWSRQRLFTAVARVLAALAELHPLAVVLEDLQWADPTTRDLVEHLLARGCDLPLLGTCRLADPHTAGATRDWLTRLRRTTAVTEMELGPLTPDETRDQLALLLGSPPTARHARRIHDLSLGHPLFTEQLATDTGAAPGRLPTLLADLLDRQVADLTAGAWALATTLGVAARPLPDALLEEVTGLAHDDHAGSLRELTERRLVVGSSPAGRLQLRHPLLAEAVRRRLVPGEASAVHRALATALAGQEGHSPAEVAAHWQAAGDVDQELGWRVRAAQEAEDRFAGVVAATHWSRALEIWPGDTVTAGAPGVRKPDAWMAALDACELGGDLSRGDSLAALAVAESSRWADEDRAEILRRVARHHNRQLRFDEAHQVLDEAIDVLRRQPASEGLVQSLDLKANTCNQQGRHREAAELRDEAREVLDQLPGSPLRRSLLAGIAWQDAVTGRLDRALARIAEVAAMVPAQPEPQRDVYVGKVHTDILLKAARAPEEIEAAAAAGLAAIRGWAMDSISGNILRANVALGWLRAGEIARAAGFLEATTPQGDAREWGVHLVRVRLDCARGHAGRAREDCVRVAAERPGLVHALAPVMAELELWDPTTSDAFDPLMRSLETVPDQLTPGEAGDTLLLAVRAAAELAERTTSHGSPAGRRRLRARLDDLLHRMGHDPFAPDAVPSDRRAALQWHAELARLAGTATVQDWLAAATAWDGVSRPHDAAYCRWRAGQAASTAGRHALAARLLDRAAREAREHVPLTAAIAATTKAA